MTPARVAAQALELLGAVDGPIVIAGVEAELAAPARVAREGEPAVGALCSFLGEPAIASARAARLGAMAQRLPSGAPLVVVDHNQPRAWWRRVVGWGTLARRGLGPARARYPVAREAQGHGFTIERMRFADGERVQLVLARRR